MSSVLDQVKALAAAFVKDLTQVIGEAVVEEYSLDECNAAADLLEKSGLWSAKTAATYHQHGNKVQALGALLSAESKRALLRLRSGEIAEDLIEEIKASRAEAQAAEKRLADLKEAKAKKARADAADRAEKLKAYRRQAATGVIMDDHVPVDEAGELLPRPVPPVREEPVTVADPMVDEPAEEVKPLASKKQRTTRRK